MKLWRCLLSSLAVLTLTCWAGAQDIVSVSVPAASVEPVAAPPVLPSRPPTTTLAECSSCGEDVCDPKCNLYWLYVHYGVKTSFEMYARVGPSFITSSGDLDNVLHTGVAADFGVKTFCYDQQRTSGWYGELTGNYIFNNANSLVPLIDAFPVLDVTRTNVFGQQVNLTAAAFDRRGITELHRVYAGVGGGYQLYWGEECPGSLKWFVDLNGGVRLGHAHAATRLLTRQFLDGFEPQDGDVISNNVQRVYTDFIKNFYIGGGIGALAPYCGYDVAVAITWEYSHDIILLPTVRNSDVGLDQVKAQVMAGLRW